MKLRNRTRDGRIRNVANDILGKIIGLKKKAVYDMIKTGSTPKETLLNRCLAHIQAIQELTQVTAHQRKQALDKAWITYLELTDLPGPERLTYDAYREVPLHTIDKESIVVDPELPDVYRGGLGYSQMTWGVTFPSKMSKNAVWGDQYWQPARAKKNQHRSLGKDYWVYRKKDDERDL